MGRVSVSASIAANLAVIREQIETACKKAGRNQADVEILIATKYASVEEMGELAKAGITLVGENRCQDLLAKYARWGDAFSWDFIGHLQSRKVKQILPHVRLIHSVSSQSALAQIDRCSRETTEVLLEVNLAKEASKSGIAARELEPFIEQASQFGQLRFGGLMMMPPLARDPEDNRVYFAELRVLAHELTRHWSPRHQFRQLSMGTSQDFVVAVEEGSTIVRLGSILWQ